MLSRGVKQKMETEELNSIANAVAKAVGALNVDKLEEKEKTEGKSESFECPECGGKVSARSVHCPHCGIELEWGE